MKDLAGIGKLDRTRLSEVIRGTKGSVSVSEASAILKLPPNETAKILARWAKSGWLSRIKRGVYIPVPLESRTADISLEEPWVIAERLFAPCYIGGLSAAEHWGLTEQIFRSVSVMTAKRPRNRAPVIKGTKFVLRTVPSKAMFGLKPVWKGQVKVSVSDPSRTIIDMLDSPEVGGGIRPTADIFAAYLKSDNPDMDLLLAYAKKKGKGSIYKRLGFLLERSAPEQAKALNTCRESISKGNSQLDPNVKGNVLITRWRLWVPDNWTVKREPKL